MIKHVVPAVFAAFALAIIGVISVAAQQPILVPSLGSAIFVQTLTPVQGSSKSWNMLIGQLAGVIGGLIGVYVARAAADPSFMDHHPLTYARVLAATIAALVTALLQSICKADNPAGGAIAIILAIGAETANWPGTWRLVAGIALITLIGELSRRVILKYQ